MRRSKKSPRASAKKRLDDVFSKWTRLKGADKDGFCTCVTCGKRAHWKEQQAGHYVSRQHMATRWMPDNVHVQCPRCNIFMKGNMDAYALFIVRVYGAAHLEKLNMAKHTITKYHTYDMDAMITMYECELHNLMIGKN